MNEQEFVLAQIEWLQLQFQRAAETDTRERIITAIEDIVIATLTEDVFPAFQADKDLPA